MNDTAPDTLLLPAADVPPALDGWLAAHPAAVMLVSVERLPDGQLVLQSLPGIDPALVAHLRKIMAQYADVLRRLT
jgi:hypothetical protein